MKIPFWKMHGAGNDFILLNQCNMATPFPSSRNIQNWCRQHTGIGADGLILVQASDNPDDHFRMVFFNPDGGEASMCGNGARCVARFAFENKIAPAQMRFATGSGHIHAFVDGSSVTLDMQIPNVVKLDQTLTIGNDTYQYHFADTGVPHAVVICPNVDKIDLPHLGKPIREHACFSPEGTNVDFVEVMPDNSLRIRTYERGVEAETLACGTGVAAAAVTSVLKRRTQSPVQVHTAGGDTIHVTISHQAGRMNKLQITGPAKHVFHGYITDTL